MIDYLDAITSHLDRLIGEGTDRYGPAATPMWMSALDTHTGHYPEDSTEAGMAYEIDPTIANNRGTPVHVGQRTYRSIHAPRGCSLYWDQPQIVAAHAISDHTGESRYAHAADAYVSSFLDHCVATNGIFLWGNHYYYDAFRDEVVWFNGDEPPQVCDPEQEDGWLHETRPVPPAWEGFWRLSPEKTEACIRAVVGAHLFDGQTGGFNRHADGKRSCAFLESGGILVESACWLAARCNDAGLVDTALRLARFSYGHRGSQTGLLENNPTVTRWDKVSATTEIGLWAGSLLRAAGYADQTELGACRNSRGPSRMHSTPPGLAQMAQDGVDAYLRHGYDQGNGRYYGRLNVADGTPLRDPKETLFQPGDFSDPWLPLFPAHDYPMALAETLVRLARDTGDGHYFEAIERWIRILDEMLPARGTPALYAEHWGRCIHFLSRAAVELNLDEAAGLAEIYAERAVAELFDRRMFRGHTGSDHYYAVDGVGFLLLSLIHLVTGEEPDGMGFGF